MFVEAVGFRLAPLFVLLPCVGEGEPSVLVAYIEVSVAEQVQVAAAMHPVVVISQGRQHHALVMPAQVIVYLAQALLLECKEVGAYQLHHIISPESGQQGHHLGQIAHGTPSTRLALQGDVLRHLPPAQWFADDKRFVTQPLEAECEIVVRHRGVAKEEYLHLLCFLLVITGRLFAPTGIHPRAVQRAFPPSAPPSPA